MPKRKRPAALPKTQARRIERELREQNASNTEMRNLLTEDQRRERQQQAGIHLVNLLNEDELSYIEDTEKYLRGGKDQ